MPSREFIFRALGSAEPTNRSNFPMESPRATTSVLAKTLADNLGLLRWFSPASLSAHIHEFGIFARSNWPHDYLRCHTLRFKTLVAARWPRRSCVPEPCQHAPAWLRQTAAQSESRHAGRGAAVKTLAADCLDRAPSRCALPILRTKPARNVSEGCPVKLVMVSISSRNEGTRSRSTCEKTRAISMATFRRKRSLCTKSTAERNRDWRKRLGHASGTWTLSWSMPWLKCQILKRCGASANRMTLRES